MDRNTVIGLLLIGILLFAYSIYTKPDKEQLEKARIRQDSIANVEQQRVIQEKIKEQEAINAEQVLTEEGNAASMEMAEKEFGMFSQSAVGKPNFVTLENKKISLKISNKGGRIYSVNLLEYRTHDSLPLLLFNGDSTEFGFNFFAQNRSISTNNLFFKTENSEPIIKVSSKAESVSYRLQASENQYIEYVYTLEPDAYIVKFDVNFVGMNEIIAQNTQFLTLNWKYFVPSQEKGSTFENQYTSIYYKYLDDEVDKLSARSDDSQESLKTRLKWIAFKQQFFSSVIIAENSFSNAIVKQQKLEENATFLKYFESEISLPYKGKISESIPMSFYFGPNHYKTLRKYNLDMDKLVELGWGIFGLINRFAIIPIFNWLNKFIANYGLIILILTLIIKIVIFPFTFKSYKSTAKMRVLKPQIDEITKKFPKKEDAMKKQQATMALYKKVGVNPLGGCLPMVFQMPILFAMFRFFPASIELRQKSFLWAEDLSSYDSVLDLPFEIPFYGDHVSLFTLLMTVSTIIYTRINSQMQDTNAQMPGMKYMMYMFPFMMLFWFNSYASGLSYYYFLANILTFAQMYFIKRFVDDEEVLKKLQASKKKPQKKSGFQKRLEDAAKNRGYKIPKK